MEKEKLTEQEEELLNIKEFQESSENTDILDDDEIEDVIYKSNYDFYLERESNKPKKSWVRILAESVASFLLAIIASIIVFILSICVAVASIVTIPFTSIYEAIRRDFFDTEKTEEKIKKKNTD